jgi:RimJ/RimL family protein N-acetyltransferase
VWAAERIPHVDDWGVFEAIGLEHDGQIVAATIYNHYTGPNIMTSIAGAPGRRWLTRAYLRAIFRYPFVQLGVRRITALVATRNADSIRFVTHLGFKREGLMRHAAVDDDLIVFGMTREECKYT